MKEVISLGIDINPSFIALVFVQAQRNFSKKFAYKKIARKKEDFDVFDVNSAALIEKEIKRVEKEWDKKVTNIYYSFPSYLVRKIIGISRNVVHPRSSVAIAQKNIKASVEQAKLLNVDWNLHSIHSLALEFKLDGKLFKKPPLGIYGRRLETKAVFYTCKEKTILNIDRFFQYLGKDYAQLVLSPLAQVAAYKEKDIANGNFILLNFGRKRIEVSCFLNYVLVDVVNLPYGGDYLSNKLAQELDISFGLAENLKVSYGSLEEEDLHSQKSVTTKREFNYKEMQLGDINSRLSRLYQEFFYKIKNLLVENNMLRKADFLVVSGGTSRIKGFKNELEHIVSIPIQKPSTYIEADLENEDEFTAAFGSLRFSSSKVNLEQTYSLPKSLLKRITNIWEEYF